MTPQAKLRKRTNRPLTIKQQRAKFDRFNRDWAEKILRNPANHPPYMVTTARSVLNRLEEKECPGPKQTLMPFTEN